MSDGGGGGEGGVAVLKFPVSIYKVDEENAHGDG